MNFFAYKNKWGRVIAKPHDMADVLEALNSPSVIGIMRHIEAGSLAEAQSEAERLNLRGRFETTNGGK